MIKFIIKCLIVCFISVALIWITLAEIIKARERKMDLPIGVSMDEAQKQFPTAAVVETKYDFGDGPNELQKRTKGFYVMRIEGQKQLFVFNYYKKLIAVEKDQ